MTKTAKTRPAVGAARRAVENGSVCKTAQPSTTNHTTDASGNQTFCVADLLLRGQENALPRRHLIALTGFTDRELRRQIEAERRQGIPILSDCVGGYYLPGDPSERARNLRRRASEIMETAAAIERGDGA